MQTITYPMRLRSPVLTEHTQYVCGFLYNIKRAPHIRERKKEKTLPYWLVNSSPSNPVHPPSAYIERIWSEHLPACTGQSNTKAAKQMTTAIGDVNNILQLLYHTVDDVLMANYLLVMFQIERNDSSQDKTRDESRSRHNPVVGLWNLFFIIGHTATTQSKK